MASNLLASCSQQRWPPTYQLLVSSSDARSSSSLLFLVAMASNLLASCSQQRCQELLVASCSQQRWPPIRTTVNTTCFWSSLPIWHSCPVATEQMPDASGCINSLRGRSPFFPFVSRTLTLAPTPRLNPQSFRSLQIFSCKASFACSYLFLLLWCLFLQMFLSLLPFFFFN